jgi:hypothetical protein
VVAAGGGLDDLGLAVGLEPREHERGLHLPAGHRELVPHAVQRAAPDHERGPPTPVASVDRRAHGPQRVEHARHRALRQRRVADEHAEERQPRAQAGEEAHRGAGVAAVEHLGRLREPGEAPARDPDGVVADGLDHHPEAAEHRVRARDVAAGAEVGEVALPVGDPRGEQRPVRHALAARQPQPSGQWRTAVDPHLGHDSTRREWW